MGATGAGAVNIRLGLVVSDLISGANAGRAAINRLTSDVSGRLAGGFAQADRQQRIYDRGLGRLGTTMQDFGKKASIVSGILVGVGAAAFGSYSDIDGMQRALKAVTGSTQQANAEFIQYRQLAKPPGLGLEEVVQGGLQLETLGFQAKEAQKSIYEVGNAIALGGKGKVEFGSVITQFTQMAGKAKVLGDDLKPIVNASPVIAKAISNIFGTVDSEAISAKLQAAGKGPRDFINVLVSELSKLERVEGGPKNAIENFTDSLTIAGYETGKAADEVLGLSDKIDSAGSTVSRAATAFGQLPTPVKAAALSVVGLAVGIPPLLLGLGALVSLGPTVAAGLGLIRNGMVLAKAAALSLVTPVGAVVAAVVAIAGAAYFVGRALDQYDAKLETAADRSKLFTDVNNKVAASIAGETTKLSALLAIARDETISKEARLKAVKDINAISPQYLGNLKLESINTAEATKAITTYTNALTLKAKVQVLSQRAAEAQVKADEIAAKSAKEFVDRSYFSADVLAVNAKTQLKNPFNGDLQRAQEALFAEMGKKRKDAAAQLAQNEANVLARALERTIVDANKAGVNVDIPGATSGLDLSGVSTANYDALQQKVDRLKNQIRELKAANKPVPDSLMREYTKAAKELDAANDAVKFSTKDAKTAFEEYKAELEKTKKIVESLQLRGLTTLGGLGTADQQRLEQYTEKLLAMQEVMASIEADQKRLEDFTNKDGIYKKVDPIRSPATDQRTVAIVGQDPRLIDFYQQLRDRQREHGQLLIDERRKILFQLRDTRLFGNGTDAVKSFVNSDGFGLTGLRDKLKEQIGEITDTLKGAKSALISGGLDMAEGLGQTLVAATTGSKAAFTGLIQSGFTLLATYLKQLAQARIVAGAALIAASVYPPNPVGLSQGKALITTGGGLRVAAGIVSGLGTALSVAKFAKGGIVFGPTMGLMGEYAGARNNPEVIAPLDRLKRLIGNTGTQVMIPDIILDGHMIRIVLKRAENSYAQFS